MLNGRIFKVTTSAGLVHVAARTSADARRITSGSLGSTVVIRSVEPDDDAAPLPQGAVGGIVPRESLA